MSETPHPDAHAFVLAGGRGTRFWPLSRAVRPKQLLDFTGEGSLLALTLERVAPLVPSGRQWILTSADLRPAVARVAPALPPERVVGEPQGRNTAPAVALAAALLERNVGDVPFVVLPSDHLITPADRFRAALHRALDVAASSDVLLTFGVRPSRPETGYGYVEAGDPWSPGSTVRRVTAFREKPDLVTARRYAADGRHLWNSGMFAWRPSVVLAGLQRHLPDLAHGARRAAAAGAPGTSAFASALEGLYAAAPSISIDYALMEKASNVGVVPVDFSWNDVGHWMAMRDLWPADDLDNATQGTIVPVDSHRNVVYGPGRVTALVGVDDLVVVHTDDATLVCAADRVQDVRRVLDRLEREGLTRYL